ncbi:unnamed protein product [Dimorphilus gyrociliatus]|uniref:Uncharacterized protein n=1 Tax=Dimorphilus gyrociliatus TaxID=2664684 RepID=A0A7I8VLQ6_9ANNE|nr:unnamed protein product [Dimorphilus gyrociliatus]
MKHDCKDNSDEIPAICSKIFGVSELLYCKFISTYIPKLEEKSCLVEYDSFGNLKTQVHYPFRTLETCDSSNMNDCREGEYKCKEEGKLICLSIHQVCDGIGHCPNNDDEIKCGFNS